MGKNLSESQQKNLNELRFFIENCTSYKGSANNYTDFKRINECLNQIIKSEHEVSVLDYTDPEEFTEIINKLNSNELYIEYNKKGNNQYSNTVAGYLRFLKAKKYFNNTNTTTIMDCNITKNEEPLPFARFSEQTIYYGAPGTGKSHTIRQLENDVNNPIVCIRTTFHPDSDYSTFVGCYKPHKDKSTNSLTYTFVPQAFLEAYVKAWTNPEKRIALVIEEINRGNCAQIFGDIFQLLDRDEDGWSTYPIKADTDITDYLEELQIPNYSETLVNKYGENKDGFAFLALPPNLSILATMNTSDQSLFPIDSAFKRRWDWKYVPISNANLGWVVCINGIRYDWWSFVEEINKEIGDATHSEDKKLGYFFCKAKKDDNTIAAEKFVGKVLFYIYNDVFRDYGFDRSIFKDENDKENPILMFKDFFMADGKPREDKIKVLMDNLHVKTDAEVNYAPIDDNDDENIVSEEYEEIDPTNDNIANEIVNIDGKDHTKYSFNGFDNLGKGELAVKIIEKYLSENKELTYQLIKETFPDSLMGNQLKLRGLIVSEKDIADAPYSYKKKAYGCFKADRHYKSSDGVEFYISNNWNITNIQSIIDFAKKQGWTVNTIQK